MDIRAGIVGIKSDPKSKLTLGTGFFVPGGLILTCAHVIADYYQPGRQIDCQLEGHISYFKTHVIFFSAEGEYDLAILQPVEDIEYIPLPISSSQASKGNSFSIFGYPKIEFRGLNGAGTIMGWTTTQHGHKILQLDSKQITHGFSGAPVYDEKLEVVVGVLQQGIKDDEIGRPSFALPIEQVKEIYPDLQVGIPTSPGGLPPGSYIPFPRNALFTGREKDLEKLSVLCEPNGSNVVISQAITGMGGIGKTQLAVEFAYRYGHCFKGVHWLDLRDPDALDASIALCGTHMGLAYDKQSEQVVHTLNIWKNDGPRLLILDNFEEVTKTGYVLSQFQHPVLRLLITSRRKDFPKSVGLQTQELDTFSEIESMEFLERTLEHKESTEARKKLAKKLGDLPLALELAVNYININSLEISAYMGELNDILTHESMQEEWFKELEITNPTEHDQSLLVTFHLSWHEVIHPKQNRLQSYNENQQKIFMLTGYCAPNTPIPLEIFKEALELDKKAVSKAIYFLSSLGLLSSANGVPTIHPLLASYSRTLDRHNNDSLETLQKALVRLSSENWASKFQPFYKHAETASHFIEKYLPEKAGSLLNWLGMFQYSIDEYESAKGLFERALKVDEITFGPGHHEVAADVRNLGDVLQELDDFNGAKAAYERALKIDETHFEQNWPQNPNPLIVWDITSDSRKLGDAMQSLGDWRKAKAVYKHTEEFLERALRTTEATGPDKSIAILLKNLGDIRRDLGELNGAKAAYERALKIDEIAFGPNHPQVADDASDLGRSLQDLGDLKGAKAVYERALKIVENAPGIDNSIIAGTAYSLGNVMHDLGDLKGAKAAFKRTRELFEHILSIDAATFGSDHPKVAADLNSLGDVLKDLGNLKGAKAAYERALNINEAAFGPDNSKVVTYAYILGSVLRDLGDLKGAKAQYERARVFLVRYLSTDTATFGPDHPKVAVDLKSLGDVLKDLGNLKGAKAAYERALEIYEAAYGPDDLYIAWVAERLGDVLQNLSDHARAKAAYKRVLKIFKQFFSAGHPKIKIVEDKLRSFDEEN